MKTVENWSQSIVDECNRELQVWSQSIIDEARKQKNDVDVNFDVDQYIEEVNVDINKDRYKLKNN